MSQEEFHVLDELVEAPDSTTAEDEGPTLLDAEELERIDSTESEQSLIPEQPRPNLPETLAENISEGNSPEPPNESCEEEEGLFDEVDWSDIQIVDEYDEEDQNQDRIEMISPDPTPEGTPEKLKAALLEAQESTPKSKSSSPPPPPPPRKPPVKDKIPVPSDPPKTKVSSPTAKSSTSKISQHSATTDKTKPKKAKQPPKPVKSEESLAPAPSPPKQSQSKTVQPPVSKSTTKVVPKAEPPPKPSTPTSSKKPTHVTPKGSSTSKLAAKVRSPADSTTKVVLKEKKVAVSKSELEPKRDKPVSTVSTYVDSLIGLEYDFKKYTCFYCNPCHAFLSTTAQWEEHISCTKHRKNVCRWRDCMELRKESKDTVPAVKQPEVDKYRDVIVGADHVVEVGGLTGPPKSWVCVLCSAVCSSVELLLGHLTSFLHIDNYMEKMEPGLYQPPGKDERVLSYIRYASSEAERRILDEARVLMEKRGRGKMRVYRGTAFVDWPDEDPENAELEESLVMDRMALLFQEDSLSEDYIFKYKIVPKNRSVANGDVSQMTVDSSNTMIGMQHLIEMWAPSRRVTPVYFCALCGYLVTNWVVHSTILKHCAAYLMKHYKSVYECVLLESSSEEEFRRVLALAREKVLLLEGRQSRVDHVVQLMPDQAEVFVAINARIALKIIETEGLKITPPPRAKKRLHTDSSGMIGNEKKRAVMKSETQKDSGKTGAVNFTKNRNPQNPSAPSSSNPSFKKTFPKKGAAGISRPPSFPKQRGSFNKPRGQGNFRPGGNPKTDFQRGGPVGNSDSKYNRGFFNKQRGGKQHAGEQRDRRAVINDSKTNRINNPAPRHIKDTARLGPDRGRPKFMRDAEGKPIPKIGSDVPQFIAKEGGPRTVYEARHAKKPSANSGSQKEQMDNQSQGGNRRAFMENLLSSQPVSTSHTASPGRSNPDFLSPADLRRLEEMLRSAAGIDLGRHLTNEDLEMLRRRLGSGVVDGLLGMIKAQNRAVDEVANSVGYRGF